MVDSSNKCVVHRALLVLEKGCLYFHGIGGRRGPDLCIIGDRLTRGQSEIRIKKGRLQPALFASSLTAYGLAQMVGCLQSRRRRVFDSPCGLRRFAARLRERSRWQANRLWAVHPPSKGVAFDLQDNAETELMPKPFV